MTAGLWVKNGSDKRSRAYRQCARIAFDVNSSVMKRLRREFLRDAVS